MNCKRCQCRIENDGQFDETINFALIKANEGKPVLVDININYKKRTRFTQGVVEVVLGRFPIGDKFRFIGRAVKRKVFE